MAAVEWSEKQQRVREAIQGDDYDRIVIAGPVQSGKSFSAIVAWIEYIRGKYPGGTEFIVASHSQRQLDAAVLSVIERWCRERTIEFKGHRGWHGVEAAKPGPGGETELVLYSLIGQKAGDEARAKSFSVASAFVDECVEVPEMFLAAIEDRCSKPGAKLVMLTNPGGPEHWFKKQWVDEALEDPQIAAFKFSLDDNPTLTQRYKDRLAKRYTGAQFQRMVMGDWAASTGFVYPMAVLAIEKPPIISERTVYTVGIDYAASSVTHAVLVARLPDQGSWVVSEWRHDGREDGQLSPTDQARRIAQWLDGFKVGRIAVDPSAPALRAALSKRVPASTRIVKADNDLDEGIQFVQQMMTAGRLRVSPACRELCRELQSYVWRDNAAEQGEDKPLKQDDHGCDALRYDQWTGAGTGAQPIRRERTARGRVTV